MGEPRISYPLRTRVSGVDIDDTTHHAEAGWQARVKLDLDDNNASRNIPR